MLDRYRKNVPEEQRVIIDGHDAPRPNWFIGSAEHSRFPRDPDLDAEIAAINQRIRDLSGAALAPDHAPEPSHEPTPQAPAFVAKP